jgi:hypothetical protein
VFRVTSSFLELFLTQRHPPTGVGSGRNHAHLTDTGSRPAFAGASRPTPRAAVAVPRSVSDRVRSRRSPALARVGCCEPLDVDGAAYSLGVPAKGNAACRPQTQSNSGPAAATGASKRAAYLQKRDVRGRLALKPAPRATRCGVHKRTRSTCRLLEHATEVAHRVHPIRSIHAQPVQNESHSGDGVKTVEKKLDGKASVLGANQKFRRRSPRLLGDEPGGGTWNGDAVSTSDRWVSAFHEVEIVG